MRAGARPGAWLFPNRVQVAELIVDARVHLALLLAI